MASGLGSLACGGEKPYSSNDSMSVGTLTFLRCSGWSGGEEKDIEGRTGCLAATAKFFVHGREGGVGETDQAEEGSSRIGDRSMCGKSFGLSEEACAVEIVN